jgi:hypothetical protein
MQRLMSGARTSLEIARPMVHHATTANRSKSSVKPYFH